MGKGLGDMTNMGEGLGGHSKNRGQFGNYATNEVHHPNICNDINGGHDEAAL